MALVPLLRSCSHKHIPLRAFRSVHLPTRAALATSTLTTSQVSNKDSHRPEGRCASGSFAPAVSSIWQPNSVATRLQISRNRHQSRFQSTSSSPLTTLSLDDPYCNIPPSIADRLGTNLHLQQNHPLQILSHKIQQHFGSNFLTLDQLSPVVSTHDCFDTLRIPLDHVSRQITDTYYVNPQTVLRTHTSAHQIDTLQQGHNQFLVVGDVYRRDEIDKSHYPVFHQMEGVKIFTNDDFAAANVSLSSQEAQLAHIEQHLKHTLEQLAISIFGECEMRWVDEYFPFTHPSFELEILFQGEWMEVLGCGVVHPEIMANAGRPHEQGWAFGLGLERWAMVLFDIPDIRLFWTQDDRFHRQFQSGEIVTFQPYSKYPPCFKDLSFWIHEPKDFHVNNLMELVRNVAGDLVEEVVLIDEFTHPKTNRLSQCYRIAYRSMDRSLTNEEIDDLQFRVRKLTEEELPVELR